MFIVADWTTGDLWQHGNLWEAKHWAEYLEELGHKVHMKQVKESQAA